jgi:hypothetical protein
VTDHARLRAMIAERLNADPQLWKPEPGEQLVAMVVGRYTVRHDQYGDSPALRLWDGKSEWRWHAFGTVAEGFVTECNPRYGDWVGLKFLGDGPGYKDWRTVHIPGVDAPTPVGVESAVGSAPDRPTPPEDDDPSHCATCAKPIKGRYETEGGKFFHVGPCWRDRTF